MGHQTGYRCCSDSEAAVRRCQAAAFCERLRDRSRHSAAALQDPDDDMRLKGSSGTDEHQHYVDDGLQRKYEGLHQMRLALNRDLVDMAALIGPAHAELSYLKLFRRRTSHYSMCIYRDVNRYLPGLTPGRICM